MNPGIPGLPGDPGGTSYLGQYGYGVGGIEEAIKRWLESQANLGGYKPEYGQPASSSSGVVRHDMTKDDLESSRNPYTAPAPAPFDPSGPLDLSNIQQLIHGRPEGDWGGIPYSSRTSGALAESPHIRFARPGEEMQDYVPNHTGVYEGQGGFVGAQGHPGGGAFSPSQPFVDANGNKNVANPEAFEDYNLPIRDAMRRAELARQEMLAKDPLAEERAKAEIWANAQGMAQGGIMSAMDRRRQALIDQITKDVEREMPGVSTQQKQQEVQKRIDNATYSGGTGASGAGSSSGHLPTLGGFPALQPSRIP